MSKRKKPSQTGSGAQFVPEETPVKASRKVEFQFPSRRDMQKTREQKQLNKLTIELQAAREREESLLQEREELSQRQVMLAHEFEHRLINSLQLISSLLSLQSRRATTPEATDQLAIASRRVAALGRVHRRLHLLDHVENVEFKDYLQHLCADLAGLLFEKGAGSAIVVEGERIEIPTEFAIPLGFIVNELITNSAKYAGGNIVVRLSAVSPGVHSLSVVDDGPGFVKGFDPKNSRGLGMKIVLSMVKQIGGELQISPGDSGSGARFTVMFGTSESRT
jgi:two-component sensor histidine kinase